MDREHQDFVNLLRRIEVQFGKDGWHGDETVMPRVYGLFRVSSTRLKPIELRVDPELWGRGTPGDVLVAVAKTMPRTQKRMATVFRLGEEIGYRWIGLALAMEAWMVSVNDPAETEEMMDMANRRLIHRHPKRESIRIVYGITRTQSRAVVMRLESEPEGMRVEDDANFPGGVQEGLATLVAAFDDLLG